MWRPACGSGSGTIWRGCWAGASASPRGGRGACRRTRPPAPSLGQRPGSGGGACDHPRRGRVPALARARRAARPAPLARARRPRDLLRPAERKPSRAPDRRGPGPAACRNRTGGGAGGRIRRSASRNTTSAATGEETPPARSSSPGQVEDDASILTGAGEVRTNLALLEAVRAANPDATILYKPHPDVEAGLRRGRVPEAEVLALADRIVTGDPARLLLPGVSVWTMTSLLGFEALIRGLPVTTLGAPFYAGWGLTRDLGPVPARRTARPTLAGLAHAALIGYPRYIDPAPASPARPKSRSSGWRRARCRRPRASWPGCRGCGATLLPRSAGSLSPPASSGAGRPRPPSRPRPAGSAAPRPAGRARAPRSPAAPRPRSRGPRRRPRARPRAPPTGAIAARLPPPSQKTRVSPSAPSAASSPAGSSRPPRPVGQADEPRAARLPGRRLGRTRRPRDRGAARAAPPRRSARAFPPPAGRAARGDEADRLARRAQSRTVSAGSSARAVPPPTSTASWTRRIAWTRRRASGPVIQRLSPVAVAMRPSSVSASLSVSQGRPRSMRDRNPALAARASAARTPVVTAIPFDSSSLCPAPDTRGSGSSSAVTTRATPAATSASAQGGVSP
jgi:hypothetical protein